MAVSPNLVRERCAGNHQYPAGIMVFGEPVGGLVPVVRDGPECARRGQPAGPGQRRRDQQRGQHYDPGGHSLVLLRMRHGSYPYRPGDAAGQGDSPQQMGDAEHQRYPDNWFDLVHVA